MYRYCVAAFFLSFFSLYASFSVDLSDEDGVIEDVVLKSMPLSMSLNRVTFASDILSDIKELEKLSSLSALSEVASSKVVTFLLILKKKRSYQSVEVVCSCRGNQRYDLHFMCKSVWTLRNVNVHGISLGRENYRHYYKGEAGEPFSITIHEESLAHLKKVLKQKGFFGAMVSDFFSFNQKSRTVDVNLYIERGPRFRILNVLLEVEDNDTHEHFDEIQQEMYKKYVHHLKGHHYDQEVLERAVKAIRADLLSQGFSESVFKIQEKISEESLQVKITIKIEVGRKRNITFIGNYFFSDKVLQEKITRMGDVAGILPPPLLAQDIVALYREKGFWDVKIDTHEEEESTIFIISEGHRIYIDSIQIKGTHFYQRDLIRKHFLRANLKKQFDNESLTRSIDSLIKWYKKQGYQDFEILKKHYEPQEKPAHYRLDIFVEEGLCYYFENVAIEGHEDILRFEPFFSINQKRIKTPFTYDALQQQRMWLSEYFKKQGYFSVRVTPEIETDGPKKYVMWKIMKGECAYFGKTIVQGATKLSYERILREIAYKEGDVWTADALRRSRENLRELELFKHIVMYPQALQGDEQVRHTILNLLEEDPFEVRVRMGLQQIGRNFAFKKGSTYKIGGSFLWRNMTHSADHVRIDTDVTRFKRYVRASYIRPHILNSSLRLLVRAYDNHYIQPIVLGSKEPLYEVLQQGVLLGLKGEVNGITRGLTFGIDWMETKNISEILARAIAFSPELIEKKIPYFFVEPNIFVDRLVDKVNPQSGFFSIVSLKAMLPFKKSSYFFKAMAEHSVFIPLAKGVILGARAKLGHIFRQSFQNIMPPERFYLGGSHSLRGYPPDHCPPLGSFINEKGEKKWVPQGGKTIMNINIELRVPTFIAPLQGAIFQDFGVLVQDTKLISDDTTKLAATGFGFRYLTPIGPLRFDIGWKWKKSHPDESRHTWFLIFGHAF